MCRVFSNLASPVCLVQARPYPRSPSSFASKAEQAMLESWLDRFEHGDRLALSRLLSYASQGEHLREIRARLKPPATPSRIVAITGSGGVGKSTLAGKLVELLRRENHRVAVLACDPQSPV